MGSIYQKLTESDIEKIKAELHERICVTRHEILEEVKEARAQGDYSENYELYAAKRAKGQNESRIRYLQNVLKNATIISDESPVDEVGINNTVTIYYPEDDEEETYKLVTAVRADSLSGLITMESPLGKALMGKKVGDTVKVQVSDTYSYEVVVRKIENTKDEGQEKIRRY